MMNDTVNVNKFLVYGAIVVFTVVLLVLSLSSYRFNNFQNGVCSITAQSSAAAANNRAYFLGNVHRAEIRLKADKILATKTPALITVVHADIDAIKQNKRFADQSQPFRVPGC